VFLEREREILQELGGYVLAQRELIVHHGRDLQSHSVQVLEAGDLLVTRVLYHEVEQRCLEAVCVFDRRHHDKLASSQQTFPPDLYNGEIPRIRLFRGSRIRLLSFRIIEAHHVIAASSRPIRIVTMICQKSAITWSADSFGISRQILSPTATVCSYLVLYQSLCNSP